MFKYLPNILLLTFDFIDGRFPFIFLVMFSYMYFQFFIVQLSFHYFWKTFKQINFITIINFILFINLEHFIVNSYKYVYESFWFFITVFVVSQRLCRTSPSRCHKFFLNILLLFIFFFQGNSLIWNIWNEYLFPSYLYSI